MADEINIQLNIAASSGNFQLSFRPNAISPDMATITGRDIVQSLGATIEDLQAPIDITDGGYYWFRNLSTSTSLTFDPSIQVSSCGSSAAGTTFPFLNLRPGEFAMGRCVTTAFSAIKVSPTSAAANLQFGILSA